MKHTRKKISTSSHLRSWKLKSQKETIGVISSPICYLAIVAEGFRGAAFLLNVFAPKMHKTKSHSRALRGKMLMLVKE